jgi:hypothetical protein
MIMIDPNMENKYAGRSSYWRANASQSIHLIRRYEFADGEMRRFGDRRGDGVDG